MDRLNIVDDVVLWLSLLSVAAICVVMFYYGATGLAHVPSTDFGPQKKAFGAAVFILFILLPLMILNLMLDTAFISKIFEWSMALLFVTIMIDIVMMTLLFLIM
jgi:hypothetical protein